MIEAGDTYETEDGREVLVQFVTETDEGLIIDGRYIAEDGSVDELAHVVAAVPHKERLEYLRSQIEAESISYSELAELQGLAEHIDPGDVQLLEWAGVPEEEKEEVMPYRDGVFMEPNNTDRAGWALSALNQYARETRFSSEQEIVIDHEDENGTEQLEEVASDMLCDLMHLLRKHSVDPTDIIDRAYMHFNAEEDEGG